MATVRDLLDDTLTEIGVLAAGEDATAEDAEFALRKLNRMVDTWKTERLLIYTITRTVFALTANDGEYTVGSGGNIAIDRPIYIDQINLVDTSTDPDTETPLIPLTESEYASLAHKALTANQPSHWYYNPTFSTARGTLTLWPVQTGSFSIALYVPTPVDEFASLDTSVSLPPGYREMILTNLAVSLCLPFGRSVDPDLRQMAAETKAKVKRANRRVKDQTFEAGAGVKDGGFYDILSDRYI